MSDLCVGRDCNGDELYEGDVVCLKDSPNMGRSDIFIDDFYNVQPFSYLGIPKTKKFKKQVNVYVEGEG